MKIDLKKYKLEKAASKDDERPAYNRVFLDADNSVIIASTGVVMAVVPVDLALDDTSGSVPLDALAIARKRQTKENPAELSANGNVAVSVRDGQVFFDRGEEAMPKWMKLLPKKRQKPLLTVALNPKHLADLAEALGSAGRGVQLDMYGPGKPIRVTPLNDVAGATGVVMPIKVAA